MIDALFGSKTRVKLLHLFLNNPGKSFYVREITRKIDEQINSVRRELANMLKVGIIKNNNVDNKLYYEINQRYEYYVPLRAIFGDGDMTEMALPANQKQTEDDITAILSELKGLKLAVLSGVFVSQPNSPVDLLLVGDVSAAKTKSVVSELEKHEGREINYSLMPYDDFYYRFSIRDKFLTGVIKSKHRVVIDTEKILDKSE
ncbi:MAG: transcriptional regulator [bacterium]|nr:transcriptional regulator [bacterium]MDN5835657.1 transcriptional regulator [bacterium]